MHIKNKIKRCRGSSLNFQLEKPQRGNIPTKTALIKNGGVVNEEPFFLSFSERNSLSSTMAFSWKDSEPLFA
jgi:hypothetical protein